MKDNEKDVKGFLKSLLIDVLIAAGLALIIINIVRPTIVQQTSMTNTLQPKDYLIMYKLAYIGDKIPERGDIVIFESDLLDEKGKEKLLIKRVIGLPGDKLMIKDEQLYLNGKAYKEDYLKDGVTDPRDLLSEGMTLTVPDGEFFCMGDNRLGSEDSRSSDVGTVPEERIVGKAVFRLFPFNKIGKL